MTRERKLLLVGVIKMGGGGQGKDREKRAGSIMCGKMIIKEKK